MKLSHLYIANFLGVSAVDLDLTRPVQIFAGPNGAGKSSIRDAVALALTADLGRVSLKKEAGELVHAGTDAAVVEVTDDQQEVWRVTITSAGKITDSQKGRESDPVLPYVLDAQRFARLSENERRAFLFGLMGVKMGQAEIAERLKAKGVDEKRLQRVLPLLRSGFEAASKQAKAYATEAKGAWRTVTGETYGPEKAKTWRAPVPAYDADAAQAVGAEIQRVDDALEQLQQQAGALQAQKARLNELRAKLPALREHALRIDRIEAKLKADEQSLAELEADLKKTEAAAGAAPRVGLVHELASALDELLRSLRNEDDDEALMQHAEPIVGAGVVLAAYEREYGPVNSSAGDQKARDRLPSIRKSRDLMAAAVANGKRDLDAAKAAQAQEQAIEAELAAAFPEDELAGALAKIEQLKAQRADLVRKSDTLSAAKAAADSAAKRTTDAAAHAAEVAAWDLIGDALAPSGIPAEILAEALGPINERLAQSAADADWPPVVIGPDMAITYGGRDYRLASESERWRADAMVAEAVAHLSGTHMVVLDRFDVLDTKGRQDLLGWLHTLADLGEIHTALIFGTLKALPTGLPSTVAAHWVEHGVVQQLKEAA